MKFRAVIEEIACLQHLTHILSSLVKISEIWIMKITEKNIFFILNQKILIGGMTVWCDLISESFFSQFSVEGLNKETTNEILFEISLEQLVSVLKLALRGVQFIKLKLSNKQGPCLMIVTKTSGTTSILNESLLPITLTPKQDWKYFQAMPTTFMDVSVVFPKISQFKNLVDKMHNLHDRLTLSANRQGEFEIYVSGDLVQVKTYFKRLDIYDDETYPTQSTQNSQAENQFYSVTVDTTKLLLLSNGEHLNPDKFICGIKEDNLAQFTIEHRDFTIKYHIPCTFI